MAAVVSQPSTTHLRMNLISQCFDTLREMEHFAHEGSSLTNYEAFWEQLNNGFSLTATRPYKPSNSNVEAFYRGTMSRSDFVADVEEHIIKRAQDKLDANLDPLLTISWDIYSSQTQRKALCEQVNRLLGRQLWSMFNKLDADGSGFAHISDITELVMKIFYANGQSQKPSDIEEWFCNQSRVDFWSFFSALVENHQHLLQIHIIQSLYEEVVHEILKQGKMTKKGHKVQTWKERWFVLTSTNLFYYESLENRIQKGVITINSSTKVDHLPAAKGRNYLFQVTDGATQRPYHICAPDPQMLKDWVEAIKVVVVAQSEKGRNLVHRLTLSRAKLFPESSSKLPTYSTTSTTDYNEGIYRTVKPSVPQSKDQYSRNNGATSPVSVAQSSLPASSLVSSPPGPSENKRRGPPVVPYHKISTGQLEGVPDARHDYAMIDDEDENSDLIITDIPPPLPKQRDGAGGGGKKMTHVDSNSKIDHVTAGGYDYALIDKVVDEVDEEGPPPPPVPKTKAQASILQPQQNIDHVTAGLYDFALATKSFEDDKAPPPPAPRHRGEQPSSPNRVSPTGKPLPRKQSIEHVIAGGCDYAIIDKVVDDANEEDQPPPPPLPKSGAKVLPALPIGNNFTTSSEYPGIKQYPDGIRQQPPLPKSRDLDMRIPISSPSRSPVPVLVPAGGVEAPRPAPRNKVCATKSVPPTSTFIEDGSGSYAQLSFNNMSHDDNNSRAAEDVIRGGGRGGGGGGGRGGGVQQQAPIKSSVARTKFDYSDVMLTSPVVTKDVDKALELKARKPPPSLPAKYDPKTKKSSSTGSLLGTTSLEPDVVDGVPHPYQNVHYTGTGSEETSAPPHTYQNVHYTNNDEPPPPPVPQRLASNRDAQPSGPVPPPRSPRRPDFVPTPSFPSFPSRS